jgi:parallel beta-helix repeat protein
VSAGIQTNYGCTVTGCACYQNGGNGIALGNGSVVNKCAVHGNFGNGIATTAVSANGTGCVITNCAAGFNRQHGISASMRSLIKDNNCDTNGSGAGNEGAGVYCSSIDNRIDGNNCSGNTWGIRVATSGNFITRNTCSGNTTNWEIAANNVCLVLSASLSAAISGNSGGVSPGSTNPNANFTF